MAPGPTTAAASGLPPRGDLAGRRLFTTSLFTNDGKISEDLKVGDGNGWVHCAIGHRHWGLFGAAGLLISNGTHVLLQHRAAWTHEGDTWAVPGGARDSHEDPVTAAMREAAEETSLDPSGITVVQEWVDDHGGWSYTTVVARCVATVPVEPINAESTALAWWPITSVESLRLHRGFAASWPAVRALLD